MLWLLAAAVLAAAIVLIERLFVAPEDQISADDLLALPGSRIRLVARVERYLIRFVDPPVRGERVEFLEGDRLVGEAVTDALGFASIEIDAGPVGRRRFTVRTRRAAEVLMVDVLPADAPVLVLDIDHTITTVSTFRMAFTTNRKTGHLPDAVETIRRLARRFAVVYLTARDRSFLGKTRGWFVLQGLPDGPIFLRRQRFWSQKSFDHKLERLAELKKTHRCVAGVGDLSGDARAYLATGMSAFLMDPAGVLPDIEGAMRVRGWKDLEERLALMPGCPTT
jgi:hypothetical protein